MTCNVLEIEHLNLTLRASGKPVVSDLSFAVPGGATVALVGESGSGKTMTAMAVMGLLPRGIVRNGGRILIGEEDVSGFSAEQYRRLRNTRVSIVMQNPMSAFDPVLNIFSHFRETLASHGTERHSEIRTKALESLAEVGFSDPSSILELYPFQMSGGMLQRTMLALALISSPALIIADEATSDLDVLSQARVLNLLKAHCARRHLALLLITHDLSVAAALADEIVLMKEGTLIEKSSSGDFFKKPRTSYAAKLLELHRGLYTPQYLAVMAALAEEEAK